MAGCQPLAGAGAHSSVSSRAIEAVPSRSLAVQPEDALHHRSLPLIGNDELVAAAAVAEGNPAGRPASFLRAALDAGSDPVDDRRVLELREHRQHLQHHPTRRSTRIERLRRRAKRDAEPVELFSQLRELSHLTAEPVDAVDEQQIDLLLARKLERGLQAGPVELRPRRPVLLVGNDPPSLLRTHERFQPLPLRMQRGRLILLIGRDPRVQTHTQLRLLPVLEEQ